MDDRYKIIQQTAELPFGIQFEATDLLISRKAQIHRFAAPGDDAPSDWKELYNAGSGALTALSHMGLPIIYDRGINDAGPYLIRQLVNEPTLKDRLELGPLSEYETWELAQQLLEIHSVAKDRNFFHGSLRLEQISYATRPGGEKRYYVTDFGLGELHNIIHGTHKYFGHPCFISMEQVGGELPSEISQIFSIGQLLYFAMVETHPFATHRANEMADLQKNFPLPPINTFRNDIPQPMVEWMTRMMDLDPANRFANYAEALENLPAPVNTALVPTIPTTTTLQQTQVTATQATSVQQAVQQTGAQPVVYTTAVTQAVTQAVTANQPANSNSSNSALKKFTQEPLIVGGAVAALALIIGAVIFLSGGEDSKETKKENSESSSHVEHVSSNPQKNEHLSGKERLKKGLVAAFNFNKSLASEVKGSLKMEPLKAAPSFKNGLYGEGLVLSKDQFYRLSLKDFFNDGELSSFTISFWINNTQMGTPALISNAPWSQRVAKKITTQGKEFWQWAPEDKFSAERDASDARKKDWNMITLVFSLKNEEVTVFDNGHRIGSSSTKSIKNLDTEKYIYIGCDSQKKFNLPSPVVVDQLYIWDRKLSSKEIREMYKEHSTL